MSRQSLHHIRVVLGVYWAHYRQSPLQAGAILTGVVLAVALLIGVRAINDNATRSYAEATELLSQRADWLITPKSGARTLDESVYFTLRRYGYSQSLAVIEGRVVSDDGKGWRIQGSDLVAAMTAVGESGQESRLSDQSIPLARMLAGESVWLMSEQTASQARLPLTLSTQPFEVVTLSDAEELGNRVLMDISLAQQLLDKPGQLSYIALFGELSTSHQEHIRQLVSLQGELMESDQGQELESLTRSFHLNLTAMSLLAFVVSLFIAYNGIRYSMFKRQRLLAQLQQLGVKQNRVLLALAAELVLLVCIGSVVGFFVGVQLSYWLHPAVSVTLQSLYGANLLGSVWRWQWLMEAVVLTLAAALVACGGLYLQMTRQSLSQRHQVFQQQVYAYRIHRQQLWLASGLLLLVAVAFPLSSDHRFSLFLIGVTLVALPLMLPSLLTALLMVFESYVPRGLVRYGLAEAKELIGPLALAMIAMLLAVTANLAMNTLVGSFESTLRQWLTGRLHADLYLRPSPAQMVPFRDWLHEQADVDEVYEQAYLDSRYLELPIQLVTKDAVTLKETTLFKQVEQRPWERFFAGETLFISEPMALKLELSLGDEIALQELGDSVLSVGGIYFDYGNPYGEIILPDSLWLRAGLPSRPSGLGVALSGDVEGFKQTVAEEWGLTPALMYDQQQVKQRALTIFDKTFAITQVLNSLTLLVACIGLFSACYMMTQSRAAPVARLYCLGVSRLRLMTMATGQILGVVLLTCLIALPVGTALGYVLTAYITPQAFGWSIEMDWQWQNYLHVLVMTLGASVVAVALPLYQQTWRPLVSHLQREGM